MEIIQQSIHDPRRQSDTGLAVDMTRQCGYKQDPTMTVTSGGNTDVMAPTPGAKPMPGILRARLWDLGQSKLRDIHAITKTEILAMHHELGISPQADLASANSTTQCLEFDTNTVAGKAIRLKHVGDEIKPARTNTPANNYPRKRLAYARRILHWLASQHKDASWFPRVHFFDKSRRILAETSSAPEGHSLMSEFIAGVFDLNIAARLGAVVAKLHATPVPENPIRGFERNEASWWHQRQQYWGERLDIQSLQSDNSELQAARCVVHLDLDANNVTVCDSEVRLAAFECASSTGDPALDVLVVLSNYITSGVATGQKRAAESAARSFTDSYKRHAPHWGADCVRRAEKLERTIHGLKSSKQCAVT